MAATVLLALLSESGIARAADDTSGRNTLKGLTGVHVIIDGIREEQKRAGFDQATFQTDVELKLRMAGIKVLTEDEWLKSKGMPLLDVTINALHTQRGEIAPYSLGLELAQAANLSRNGAPALVVTWSTAAVGYGDLSHVRDGLKDHLEGFINAWLSVNPK